MSYKDEVFLHDIEIMRKFGEKVSGRKHWRHEINLLAQAIDESHVEADRGGYEYYFGAGIDGEYAARHPETEKAS